MAPPGPPNLSASRRHLELVFHLTNLVLASSPARLASRTLERSSTSVSAAGGLGTTLGSNEALLA